MSRLEFCISNVLFARTHYLLSKTLFISYIFFKVHKLLFLCVLDVVDSTYGTDYSVLFYEFLAQSVFGSPLLGYVLSYFYPLDNFRDAYVSDLGYDLCGAIKRRSEIAFSVIYLL